MQNSVLLLRYGFLVFKPLMVQISLQMLTQSDKSKKKSKLKSLKHSRATQTRSLSRLFLRNQKKDSVELEIRNRSQRKIYWVT